MQEEVENRTLTLGINTTKFTGRVLKAALSKYLAHRKEKKLQASRDSPGVKPFGKISMDELQQEHGDMRQVDVQDKSLRDFDRIARKHGVCYQLSHIRNGKSHIQKSLAVWKPELERYTGLVQQIKEKSKERKTLVAEKKALPIYHVKRHKALAVRIAELTEDLEELRSEKALLFQKLEYAEDAGAEEFRKDIATMEAGLKKLEAQEQRYSAELDKALAEYAELKAQASDFDSVELYQARQVLRPAQEKAAERQLEETLQKKPSLIMLLSAKQEVSRLLGEDTEERQARQMVIRRQRSDPQKPKHFQR